MKNDALHTIFLGADLCLDKHITEEKMRQYVQQMYHSGIHLIRLYPYWAHIEETKGVYRLEAYDVCFQEAEKLGMKIFFTFKPNSPPWWMEMTASFNLDDYPYLEEPEYFNTFLTYVRHVVNRYKDEPALIAWCIWNEPRLELPTELKEQTLKEYQSFLFRQYDGDIKKLNRLYFYQYQSFDEILPPKKFNVSDMPEKSDFFRFATDTLSRIIEKIGLEIKQIDSNHPTHMNTHSAEVQPLFYSHNIWKQTKTVDFPGLSVYPKMTDEWPGSATVNSFFTSFIRSVSKDVFWITELQGGPAIYTYTSNGISTPEESDLQLALWDYFGGGAKACVFWSFTPTVRGEWSLLGLCGQETNRMKAIKDVYETIEQNRVLLETATPEQADIYILASEASMIHDTLLDKGAEYINRYTHVRAQVGAHNFFRKLGYVTNFIDEELLLEKGLPQEAILIAPSCTALQEKTLSFLERYVKAGGCLIADSLFAWKEEHCLVSNHNIETSNRLFGTEWITIADIRHSINAVNPQGRPLYPALFTRSIFSDSAKVLCSLETGEPAVIYNTYEKGCTIRFTTEIFRSSITHDMCGAAEVLKNYLPKKRKNTIWLQNGDDSFYLHVLHAKDTKILVLLNYDKNEKTATLIGCEDFFLYDIKTKEAIQKDAIIVPPRGVRLLIAKPN